MRITVDEGGLPADNIDATGLSQLAFENNATHLQQTQASQDSEISINGLAITRDTNTVTGAIKGVTLNLLSTDIGNPTKLDISKSTDSASEAIHGFVESYNELVTTLNSLTEFNSDTGNGNVLTGDTTAISIINKIRNGMSEYVTGLEGDYQSLFQIGVSTQRDGSLLIDESVLSAALADDIDSVGQLFSVSGSTTNSNVTYLSAGVNAQPGNYSVYVSSVATQGDLVGDVIAEPITIDATNNTLNITVDNKPVSVTLTQKDYTGAELAQEIQNRINENSTLQTAGASVSVSFDTDHLEITSSKYGSESNVTIASDHAALGLNTTSISTAGTDVVGSINGVQAEGDGQYLTGTGVVDGLKLQITGNTVGALGKVNYSLGYAAKLDNLVSSMLASDGLVTAKTDSLENQVEDINLERKRLDERVTAYEERMKKQFVDLDVLLNSLNATSDYLATQLDSLVGSTYSKD
ncbi:MAG: flagellar filament capping protein FliD [Gammaproteobacteria bacterium]|nr:flagellar filament capping protein FliD [Gammaproteobacteria bacterium]